jgi:hypothetical protein
MEESPHRCPICQRCFNQRSNLKTHLLTHTDIKPKQLLEIAERIESSGCRPTCSAKPLEPQIRHMAGDDDDIAEPDIDVCSDDDFTPEPLLGDGDDSSPTLTLPPPASSLFPLLCRVEQSTSAASSLLLESTEPRVKLERSHGFSIAELMRR